MTKPVISRKSSKSNVRDGSLPNEIAEVAAPIPETNDESALDSAIKLSTSQQNENEKDEGDLPLPMLSTDQ